MYFIVSITNIYKIVLFPMNIINVIYIFHGMSCDKLPETVKYSPVPPFT